MLKTLARRLATAAMTLFFVSILVFVMTAVSWGDPIFGDDEQQAATLPPAWVEQIRELYHLDEPIHTRYLLWLGDLGRGDLGRSLLDNRPVADKIGERLPTTMLLSSLSLLLTILVSIPLGTAAALRPGSRVDRWSGIGSYALFAVPSFWAALLLQIALAVRLEWLPLSGLSTEGAEYLSPWSQLGDTAAHLVLPVLTMTYGGVAYLSRFVRANLIENMGADSARAARARGLTSVAVLLRHGFRQASVPLLTYAGFLLPSLVAGSVIVESVFSIPGLGKLFVDSAIHGDMPTLMALTLLSGAATLLGILIADLTYALADPRVRRGEA